MTESSVDRLYEEFTQLLEILKDSGEISLQITAEDFFRKALLLAAASYFEHRLSQEILSFVEKASSGNALVISIVQKKAVDRQYHSWFKWDGPNANSFFSLFGSAFSEHMKAVVGADEELATSIKSFLELGNERNLVVHQNYGVFPLEKTSGEIHALYLSGIKFVDAVSTELKGFLKRL